MDFAASLDRYLTTPPDNSHFERWCEQVSNLLTQTVYDHFDNSETNVWSYLHLKGYTPDEAAKMMGKVFESLSKKWVNYSANLPY